LLYTPVEYIKIDLIGIYGCKLVPTSYAFIQLIIPLSVFIVTTPVLHRPKRKMRQIL